MAHHIDASLLQVLCSLLIVHDGQKSVLASAPRIPPESLEGRVLGDRRILPIELGQEAGDPLLGCEGSVMGTANMTSAYGGALWCRGSVMNFSSTAAVSVTKFLRLRKGSQARRNCKAGIRANGKGQKGHCQPCTLQAGRGPCQNTLFERSLRRHPTCAASMLISLLPGG